MSSELTQFQPGNPGRPKGSRNAKTVQWEALHESIVGEHCERFNNFLNTLWQGDLDNQLMAAELYLRMLEYFNPKQARQVVAGEIDSPVQIIISDSI